MNFPVEKSIVIVDDEKSYVDLLSVTLAEYFSNPVYTFVRPLEAISALPCLNAGVVVTDYYMPQLNGLDFIMRARGLVPGIPFVIITGHGVHLPDDRFPNIPELKGVLHKPFRWRTLADEITRVWQGSDAPVPRASVLSE